MFNIQYKKFGDVVVGIIHATQVVDPALVSDFGDEVIGFLERHPDSHLLLNFSKVDFISSALLSELLRVNETVRKQRGSLRLCGLRKEMMEVFHVTKLDAMFHIEEDCRACLKQFAADVARAKEGP